MSDECQIIIGLGSGRCGTVSLAHLLNLQQHCHASHECVGPGDWYGAFDPLKDVVTKHTDGNLFSCDVSLYNLPHVDNYIKAFPNVKFIILRRNISDTVESFMSKTVGRNHWQAHNGIEYKPCDWDTAFPKFPAENKECAIGKYWHMYYSACAKIDPSRCFWFETDKLNNKDACIEMLEWCGFSNPKYKLIHLNERKYI